MLLARLGPAAVAAALGAIIVAELSGGTPPLQPPGPLARPVPAHSDGGKPTTRTEAERVATILARPLFTPSRRPPAGPASAGGLRLSGVVVGPDSRLAIFEPPKGGKPVIVQVGQQVSGAVVRAIGPTSVLLTGPDGPRVLQPADQAAGRSSGPIDRTLTAPHTTMAQRLLEEK